MNPIDRRNANAEQYRRLREKIGTQEEVAALLGITRETLNRRENGRTEISSEAWIAIEYLPHCTGGLKHTPRTRGTSTTTKKHKTLSEEERKEIRRRKAEGSLPDYRTAGREYGVSRQTIANTLTRENRK